MKFVTHLVTLCFKARVYGKFYLLNEIQKSEMNKTS